MKALKATLTAALLAAAALGLANMSLNAAVHEADTAPRPTLAELDNWCGQGDQDACEAYFDRVNAGEQQ
ncbi:hypothetical protein KRX19_05735 [Cardiobacteriaceae bacterium TAE3-ERU3]|nr:hypothetical protein [Cardiobacteriaceae bacterium TAE3-ERU3]